MNRGSNIAGAACEFCALVWGLCWFAAAGYLVFWMNHSGWWFVMAAFMSNGWSCKGYHTNEKR
jgi:hypothetical protein